ncbi:hypothetical protein DWB77_07381 [Streptomyces hundungensis]|uniref:Uncharacterized protein n=1 Tax=Streptomyces hundungensis TaxID=1077946 RepID=A0A387HNN5_9ACTN|nr:hypothetical protein DWB77_07381 [Streptomyces hundungensis]
MLHDASRAVREVGQGPGPLAHPPPAGRGADGMAERRLLRYDCDGEYRKKGGGVGADFGAVPTQLPLNTIKDSVAPPMAVVHLCRLKEY